MDDGVRLPNRSRSYTPEPTPAKSVYVPSKKKAKKEEEKQGGWGIALAVIGVVLVLGVGLLIALPYFRTKPRDAVETVAAEYLDALVNKDEETAGRLGVVEEPPGISSYKNLARQKSGDRTIKGPFATVAALNKKIDKDFTYDATSGRFTSKNGLGLAAETLDSLHEAKAEAKKSGMYDKMKSGDPNEIFDSAEQLGKQMEKVSDILTPARLVPTYKMLIENAKPPLTGEARALALIVAADPMRWKALLKRHFFTLKSDGPFIYEEAVVTATARDRLASLGDPPSQFRVELVRFRLEAIDTGWKVVSAHRIEPGEENKPKAPAEPKPSTSSYAEAKPSPGETKSLGEIPKSLGEIPSLGDTPAPAATKPAQPEN